MENKLTIREIAKLFDMSAEAIRLYERENILRPVRDSKNGYRYFDKYTILRLGSCKRLRSMHFSMHEIQSVLRQDSLDNFIPLLEEKQQEVRRQIQWQEQVAQFMEEYLGLLRDAQENPDKLTIGQSPEILYFLHHDNESIVSDPHISKLFPEWINKMPLVRIFSLVSKDSVLDPLLSLERQGGYAITEPHAQLLGFREDGARIKRIPAQLCVHTVLRVSNNPQSLNSRFDPALAYMRSQGLRLAGDPWGFQLFVNYQDREKLGADTRQREVGDVYYQYYLPVCE